MINSLNVSRDILIPLVLLTLMALPLFFVISPLSLFLFFCAGLLLGLVAIQVDKVWLYHYYADSNENFFLITRSLPFLLVLLPLTIFVFTSTGSMIGIGMLLSINVVLMLEMWQYRQDQEQFRQLFLKELKSTVSEKLVRSIVWGSTAWVGLLFLLIVL